MKSASLGTSILEIEVTNVSSNGIWILLNNRELFLGYDQFPWFKNATIEQVLNVEMPTTKHLYWPSLDIDLAVESIDHPELYPLVSKGNA